MIWIGLAIMIVVVGSIIYSKRRRSVTLSKEQTESRLKLVRKERDEIAIKMHDLVDSEALQGKTLPIDSIYPDTTKMTETKKNESARIKTELMEKYGPTIPVNTAHRISREFEGNEKMWSDAPGCFERHLQRRDGNPLFPPGRRIITRKEIEKAREKDTIEKQDFKRKFKKFHDARAAMEDNFPLDHAISFLREIQSLLEEGATIGENVEPFMRVLEGVEDTLIKQINKVFPDGSELIQKTHLLSYLKRFSFFAQLSRKDSPILPEEKTPSLLSEDLEIISLEGYKSRSFGSDYRPDETEIRRCLIRALNYGFSKERADRIIKAWNKLDNENGKQARLET